MIDKPDQNLVYISKLRELDRSEDLVSINLAPIQAFQIIGQLQFALSHPKNDGASAIAAYNVIAQIRKQICDRVPELDSLIERGFVKAPKADPPKYWVKLKPESPYTSIDHLFPKGYPIKHPFPFYAGDFELWELDLSRFDAVQFEAIVSAISQELQIPKAQVLAIARKQGLVVEGSWIEGCREEHCD